MRYVYSIDGGRTFNQKTYATRKLAAEGAKKDNPTARAEDVATGILTSYRPQINVKVIVRQLRKDARKSYGSLADDWLGDLSAYELSSLQLRLEKGLRSWLKKKEREPNFYTVTDIELWKD